MTLFTIGTDLEFPLWDLNQNKFISAIPFIDGTKRNPEKLENQANLQYDNVALEFAVPPVNNEDDFVRIIQQTFEIVKNRIPENLTMKATPSVIFDDSELSTPESKEFGCEADFNIWTGTKNYIPRSMQKSNLRTFGGHVHIGATEDTKWIKVKRFYDVFIKTLDLTLGFSSSCIDNSQESLRRKQLYGKAGCFRIPPHGVEYRTLSNFWVKTPESTRMVYSLVNDTIKYCNEYDATPIINKIGDRTIINIINHGLGIEAYNWLTSLNKIGFISNYSLELINLVKEQFNEETSIEEVWIRKAA